MNIWLAFLCGVNVGKRQMKMADLKAAMEAAGFTAVKTVLASGNVRFTAEDSRDAIKTRLEEIIARKFGFDVTVILRSGEDVARMLENHPFDTLDPDAELTRHVILFEAPLPRIELESRPGNTEILRMDERELYFAGYRQANGRYTEHIEEVLKPLGKAIGNTNPNTMRNWNTIGKLLK